MVHKPVLLQEIVRGLDPKVGEVYLDGTINRGGHAKEIGKLLGKDGLVIGIDADEEALAEAKDNLSELDCQVVLLQGNFRSMAEKIREAGVEQVDMILLDLGLSSDQLQDSGRGFTFQKDEPLLMTMSTKLENYPFVARDIVNIWTKEHIIDILQAYGEEQFAEEIAAAIIKARDEIEINKTGDLVKVIEEAVPSWYRHRKIHAATKTFQALRMAVNDELGALKDGMAGAWEILKPGGRLAIISFHSLEARMVKIQFQAWAKGGEGTLITKHALKAKWEETKGNARARSAQVRIISKN
ncbi:MAG: 16S rRNA (cytosine(1402)-N(4))-methyltransferase RsmH [bacterium]